MACAARPLVEATYRAGGGEMRAAKTANEATIEVWVTPKLEAKYRELGAFPELRAEKENHRVGTSMVFRVLRARADEVLDDARDRMREMGSSRGLFQSYHSMASKLRTAINNADGVKPDPGHTAAKARLLGPSPAAHDTGARFGIASGAVVLVVTPYDVYQVNDDHGPYRRSTGELVSYRPGYKVMNMASAKMCFVRAGELLDEDGNSTHLKLIHSN